MDESAPEKEYFTIRMDIMEKLIDNLSTYPELEKALGNPLDEKMVFVAAENDIIVLPSNEIKLTEEQSITFAKACQQAINKLKK